MVIGDNVIINGPFKIVDTTVIGSGSILGAEGFGFAFDNDNFSVRIPHLGGVVIGRNVEIGDQCHIARGTILDTVINNDVKINAQVRIAHNVIIGERSIIAGGVFSGSVKISEDCWVAPGAILRNKVEIGKKSVVGLGSVVTKSFPPNSIIYGVPGRLKKDD